MFNKTILIIYFLFLMDSFDRECLVCEFLTLWFTNFKLITYYMYACVISSLIIFYIALKSKP